MKRNSLFSFLFLSVLFLYSQQPIPNAIEAAVLPLLEKAEKCRLSDKYAEIEPSIKQAQSIYAQQNQPRKKLLLYARLALPYSESYAEDSTFLYKIPLAINELQSHLQTQKDDELQLIYHLLRLTQAYISEDAIALNAQVDSALLLNKENLYWDYYLAIYGIAANASAYLSLMQPELDQKTDEYCKKGISLFQNYAPKNETAKQAYLHYLYPTYLPMLYMQQGYLLRKRGEYERSLLSLEQAEKALQQQLLIDSVSLSLVAMYQAHTFNAKGDTEKAKERNKKALLLTPNYSVGSLSEHSRNVGMSYSAQFDHEEAVPYFLEALRYNEQQPEGVGKTRQKARIYNNLLFSYIELGAVDKAEVIAQALDKMPEANASPVYTTMQKGYLCSIKKEWDKAEQYFEQANALSAKTYNAIYLYRGRMHLAKQDYQKALDDFQQGIAMSCQLSAENSFYPNPSFDAILNKHSLLDFLVGKLNAMQGLLTTDSTAAQQTQWQKNVYELSMLCVDILSDVYKSFERSNSIKSLLKNSYQIYEAAIAANLRFYTQHQDSAYLHLAFEMAERSKAIFLTSTLRENNALRFAGVPDSLVEKEHLLTNNIIFYEQQLLLLGKNPNETQKITTYTEYLLAARQALDVLKKQLEIDYPKYYQLKYNQQVANAAAIQTQLKNNALFLEFFEGEKAVYVFAIDKKNGLRVHINAAVKAHLDNAALLQRNLTDASWIKNRPDSNLTQLTIAGNYFYNQYISPFVYQIQDIEELVVVSDGVLNHLPFETFVLIPPPQKTAFKDVLFLIKQYPVSYQYSGTLYLELLQNSKMTYRAKMLGFAASYNPQDTAIERLSEYLRALRRHLYPIQGTFKEIEMLENNYAGVFYTGQRANEATFKANAAKYEVLHLAMHGLVNRKQHELSSLAFSFSKDSIEDDFLHAHEIKALPINARLVTLSACETGYGNYEKGEGTISLGRSFMYAGASSLLVSLWPVNDASTLNLVQKFYGHLGNKMPKSEALYRAKLEYINEQTGTNGHPIYWAPFVLIGDDAPIIMLPAGIQWGRWGGALVIALFAVAVALGLRRLSLS